MSLLCSHFNFYSLLNGCNHFKGINIESSAYPSCFLSEHCYNVSSAALNSSNMDNHLTISFLKVNFTCWLLARFVSDVCSVWTVSRHGTGRADQQQKSVLRSASTNQRPQWGWADQWEALCPGRHKHSPLGQATSITSQQPPARAHHTGHLSQPDCHTQPALTLHSCGIQGITRSGGSLAL